MRGIGRYAYELVQAIAAGSPNIELMVSFNGQMPHLGLAAQEALAEFIAKDSMYIWHGVATGGETEKGYNAERKFSELALTHHVNCLAPDIALSLSPFEGTQDLAVPLLNSELLEMPAAGIFYDAIPYRFADAYLSTPAQKTYYQRRLQACANFDSLLCISQFSLKEVADLLPGTKGVNIAAGISESFQKLLKKGPAKDPLISGDYILYVGALDWRKNVSVVVDAFQKLPRELKRSMKFVLAGDHDPTLFGELRVRWQDNGLDEDGLISLGHVSDEGLVQLYANAALLVQPSLMEGFGLTALEALLCGTPVAAARAGALPETVGMEELLFDPHSAKSLADCIENLTNSPEVRKRILEHGKLQSRQFSWEGTAQKTVTELLYIHDRGNLGEVAGKDARQKRFLKSLQKIEIDKTVAAKALAIAEPWPKEAPRLLVDVSSSATSPAHSGIQRVTRKITASLLKNHGESTTLIFNSGEGNRNWVNIKSAEQQNSPELHGKPVFTTANDHILMLDSSWHLIDDHLHLLYEARLRKAQVTCCVFDLIPLSAPAFCVGAITASYLNWFLKALQVTTSFVCISKAVADELLALLELMEYPRKIDIGYWHLGADFTTIAPRKGGKQLRASATKSFLMVGTLEPRKGYSIALDAFEALWERGLDVSLTLVGRPGWNIHTLAERINSHPQLGRKLHWHESASDKLLGSLYQDSDCLIAASYAEGFGLPIVEAGQLGKPVIASNIRVFQEVAAGAQDVLFFETGNAESLAVVVEKFVDTQPPKLSNAEHEFPAWPNWEESSQELLHVVSGQNWYKTYTPKRKLMFLDPREIGTLRNKKPIKRQHRKSLLRVVDGPSLNVEAATQRFTIAVTNQSTVTWFGPGDPTGNLAISLSYHLLRSDEKVFRYENARFGIPLALGSGETSYLAIEIPVKWIKSGARFADIELVQENAAWFGRPVRIALHPSSAD